ncbi:50S ribosomal protein L25 [Candidatus Saccharibacteria bacterium]|nr:50S ribosomal protein L25 [Candidatus Saccharibacteria bacterium]
MSENKLALEQRTITGKKLVSLRAEDKIPSVIYGGGEPILTQSAYNDTEKVLKVVGYHSTIDLDIAGKPQMAIVKNVAIDPVSRKIINVEFQAVSADKAIEATTPIVFTGFETSEANKLHYTLLQVMEEIDVKAKPSDLPKELTVDASGLANLSDKLMVKDIVLPKGVELADKELSQDQVIANLYDPAAEAAAREAETAKAAEEAQVDAADVPSDNGSKPEEVEAAAEEPKSE